MGRYINPPSTGFELVLNDGLCVDKTELLAYTNAVMNTQHRFVCFTRPRRFGKTFAAQMLAAFYSKGAQARRLFEKLKIGRAPQDLFSPTSPPYDDYLNGCHVLFWDMAHFASTKSSATQASNWLQAALLKDLKREFADIDASAIGTVADMIRAVHAATGERFYLIIDEWDLLFREAKDNPPLQKTYLAFLQSLFDDVRLANCLCGAWLTGILSLRACGVSSALPRFSESSMVAPGELAAFTGFTTAEVQALCAQCGVDFAPMQRRYDGYPSAQASHIYNPHTVMSATLSKKFKDYWNQTETFDELRQHLDLAVEGHPQSIIALLGGQRCRVNVEAFSQNLLSVDTLDSVLTLLVHLGYLAYDSDTAEVFIPNEEVREVFVRAVRNGRRPELVKARELSSAVLSTTQKKTKVPLRHPRCQ